MGASSYSRSGKTHFPSFIPAAACALVCAYTMGALLRWAGSGHGGTFVAAGLLAVPVAGLACVAVRWGRCRSWGMALGLSVSVAATYCISARVAIGVPYGTEPSALYGLYVLESVLVGTICVVPSLLLARRVYFESSDVWASCHQLRFDHACLGTLMEIVRAEDWSRLRTLQPSTGRSSAVLMRIEYARGLPMEPVFVSVVQLRGAGHRYACRQWRVESDSAARLACALDLPLGQIQVMDSPAKRECAAWSAIDVAGSSGGDPRAEAVVASARRLSPNSSDTGCSALSFCLPVAGVPRLRAVPLAGVSAWPAGGVLVSGLIAGGVGGWLGQVAGFPEWACWGMMWTGVMMSVVGAFACAWMLPYCRAWNWRRRLQRQQGTLLTSKAWDAGWDLNISVAQTEGQAGVSPDDFGFCEFDWANQRLLIEGLRYRYLIRAEDVARLAPACNRETLAVELTCQMAGTVPLRLVLSRRDGSPLLRRLPLVRYFYPRWDGGWWLCRFSRTLAVSPT